jgi:hypothetical protein
MFWKLLQWLVGVQNKTEVSAGEKRLLEVSDEVRQLVCGRLIAGDLLS